MSNVIDHTAVETVLRYIEEYQLKGARVELEGWERFIPLSGHDKAVRFALAERRPTAMEEGAL